MAYRSQLPNQGSNPCPLQWKPNRWTARIPRAYIFNKLPDGTKAACPRTTLEIVKSERAGFVSRVTVSFSQNLAWIPARNRGLIVF